MTKRGPSAGRPRRDWTEHEDELVRKYATYGGNQMLAERIGCTAKQISSRRKTLMERDREREKMSITIKVAMKFPKLSSTKQKHITERPSWFAQEALAEGRQPEDIDTLMRARR